jgi:hypothetical protein
VVMSSAGLGPENECAGKSVAILNDKPILSSERMLHKNYDRRCSIEKKSGHESQGARRQDEMRIGTGSLTPSREWK